MNRSKCNKCGLINSSSDINCRRCGVDLRSTENAPPKYIPVAQTNDFQSSKASLNPFPFIVAIGIIIFAVVYGYTTYVSNQTKAEEDARNAKDAKIKEEQKRAEYKSKETFYEDFLKKKQEGIYR
jgi:uncharacterized membrane protein YvbJ